MNGEVLELRSERDRREGKAEGKVEALYYTAGWPVPKIAEELNMSEEQIESILAKSDQ